LNEKAFAVNFLHSFPSLLRLIVLAATDMPNVDWNQFEGFFHTGVGILQANVRVFCPTTHKGVV
jgi:hypothetical protein